MDRRAQPQQLAAVVAVEIAVNAHPRASCPRQITIPLVNASMPASFTLVRGAQLRASYITDAFGPEQLLRLVRFASSRLIVSREENQSGGY